MSSSDPLVITTIVLAAITALLVLAVVVLALRVRRLDADQRRALDGVEVDVIATLARQRRRLDELDADVVAARAHTDEVERRLRSTVSRIGVVRYDAYEDIGGELSFTAALLDEHGDGIVLTSITGRTGGRTFLTSVTDGVGSQLLSDEEVAAIASARERQRGDRVVEQGKRRWRTR